MATHMQVDLVSPERRLASLEATSIEIPAATGDMTVMADHVPTITTLRPGVLRIHSAGSVQEYLVTGGFAQIGAAVSVLVEEAHAKADLTSDIVSSMLDKAQAATEAASADAVDDARKALADLRQSVQALGVSV